MDPNLNMVSGQFFDFVRFELGGVLTHLGPVTAFKTWP